MMNCPFCKSANISNPLTINGYWWCEDCKKPFMPFIKGTDNWVSVLVSDFESKYVSRESFDDIQSRANAAERELAALKERTRWISVSERLPEDGQKVYAREYNGCITSFFYKSILRLLFIRHYTHWQPLPEPPDLK